MNRHYNIFNNDFYINNNNMLFVNDNVFLLNDAAFCLMKNFMEKVNGLSRENVNVTMEDQIIDLVQKEYDCDRLVIYNDLKRVFNTIWSGNPIIREYSSVSREIASPVQADLALTYRCNNNCVFCYHDGPKLKNEITREDFAIVLTKLNESGVFKINFTGGEPLLRFKDLEYWMDNYCEDFWIRLTTNGRLLSKKVCKSMKDKRLKHVQIAIEHNNEIFHDKICGSSGAWKDTVKGIRNAIDSGLSVSTMTTLMKENIDSMEDLIVFLSKLGIKNMGVNSLFYSGRSLDSSRLSEMELLELVNRMMIISKANYVNIEWLFPTCYKIMNPIELGFGIRRCPAASVVTIEPDGNVIPCPCWFHESMGNIMIDDWSTIWNSEVAMRILNRSISDSDKCYRCEWISQCSGACPLERSNVKKS